MANESIETEIDLSKDDKPQRQERQQQTRQSQDKEIVGNGDDDQLYEIIDDTPPEDRGRKPLPAGTKTAVPTDEEIGQYTKGVQERLKQMRKEYHDERRSKEEWQREHNAALQIAQRIHNENQQLRRLVEDGHKSMLGSNKSAIESELTALQQSLKAAHEAGDATQIAAISASLSKAAARLTSVEQASPIRFNEEQPQQQRQQQVQQAPARVTNSMQEWMDDNPWFNGPEDVEREMTSYAFGVHDSLKARGVPLESPAYYKAINEKMRQKFPEYYGDDDNGNGSQNQNGNGAAQRQPPRRTVGSASRLNGSASAQDRGQNKRVTITQSEAAVAKKLGVSLKQYAEEKLRLEQSNG